MTTNKIFQNRIKTLRSNMKKTQKQVADELNIIPRAYQQYEYGERMPSVANLISLAEYYDVSIDYLVGRTDNPKINH